MNDDILYKYFKTMKHLSDENGRIIITELLKKDRLEISDFEKKIDRTKSTIMRVLKILEEDEIIEIGELDEKRAGRRKKIYRLKNVELPGMNIQDIKEFLLEGKMPKGVQSMEIEAKFNRMKQFSVKGKIGPLEFDPSLLVSDLMLSGLDVMAAVETVLEFEALLTEGISSERISDEIAALLEKKDPIYAERYKNLIKKEIFLEPSTRDIWTMEDISKIMKDQFRLTENETRMIISEFGRFLEFLGVYKFSYNYLMQTLRLLAKKFNIEVREPNLGNFWIPEDSDLMIAGKNTNKKIFSAMLRSKEFSDEEKKEIGELRDLFSRYHKKILEKARELKIMIPSEDYIYYKRINILKEDNIPDFWEARNFGKYIERNFHLDFQRSQYIGAEVFRRLQRLGLDKISLRLVDELCREILIEKGMRKYETKTKKLVTEHFFDYKGLSTLSKSERSSALNYLVESLANKERMGQVYTHGIDGWLAVPNQLQHDLRWFLMNGFDFRPVINPPKDIPGLIQLLIRIIEEFANEVALNQNFDFFNVLISPFFENMEYKMIKRLMRLLISELDRKTWDVGLCIEVEIPEFLRDQNVWMKQKTYKTYADFENESLNIAKAILEVLAEGDPAGNLYRNPKLILKLRKNFLDSHNVLEIIPSIVERYSRNAAFGGPPLIMVNCLADPVNLNSCYFCSGQGVRLPYWKDSFGVSNLQTISINMPRLLSHESSERDAIQRVEDISSLIVSSLIQKKDIIRNGIEKKKLPLLAMPVHEDRDHYLNLENSFSTIGISQMRKALSNIYDRSIEESEDIFEFSVRLASSIQVSIDRGIEETGDREHHIFVSQTSSLPLIQGSKSYEEWLSNQLTEANIRREERIQHLLKGGKIFYLEKPETDFQGSLNRLTRSSIRLFAFISQMEK